MYYNYKNMVGIIKKIFLIVSIAIAVGVAGYIGLKVYNSITKAIVEKKIKEAGLNPGDYDLGGIATLLLLHKFLVLLQVLAVCVV